MIKLPLLSVTSVLMEREGSKKPEEVESRES
jgi:hypothetical protein